MNLKQKVKSPKASTDLGACAVTGGNGFVGSHIVRQLVERGLKVRVLDIHDTVNSDLADHSNVEYIRCDVTNSEHVQSALRGIHTIFHCAAIIDIRYSPSPTLHKVNVDGTRNVVDFCNDQSDPGNVVRNLVYTSSVEIYTVTGKEGDALKDMKEDIVRRDQYAEYGQSYPQQYAETKSIAEQMVLSNKAINGKLKVAVLRPGYVFGPHSGIIRSRMRECQPHGPIAVGNPRSLLSAVYVENVALAHVQVAEGMESGQVGVDGEAFNCVDGHVPITTFDLDLLGFKTEEIKFLSHALSVCIATVSEYSQFIRHKLIGHERNGQTSTLTFVALHFLNNVITLNGDKFDSIFGRQGMCTIDEGIKRTRKWVDIMKQQEKTECRDGFRSGRALGFGIAVVVIIFILSLVL